METQIVARAASWTLAIYLFAARVAESERARKTRGGYLENRIPVSYTHLDVYKRQEQGLNVLERLAEDLKPFATVESQPKREGRNMLMLLAPIKGAFDNEGDAEPSDK